MAVSFGVFARQHILTWNHLLSPYSLGFRGRMLELESEMKTDAIGGALILGVVAAGTSLVLNRSRTTLLLIA